MKNGPLLVTFKFSKEDELPVTPADAVDGAPVPAVSGLVDEPGDAELSESSAEMVERLADQATNVLARERTEPSGD